jgi:hypothetical protein
MNCNCLSLATAVALVALLAITGCQNDESTAVVAPPAASGPASTALADPSMDATALAPTTAAAASVASVDLGTAVGANMKITTAATAFGPNDTIIAAVSTTTSDPAATVPVKLTANWTYQNGQVVNNESKNLVFNGTNTTDFLVSKPDGWPVGKYRIEISLDDKVVQSKDLEVK